MSNASGLISLNNFPNALDQTLNHVRLEGTMVLSFGTTGVYGGSGIPVSFVTSTPGYNTSPFMAWLESQSVGWEYRFDPVYQTVHVFQDSQFPGGFPPAIVAASVAASANWGASPTVAVTATSNQQAFSATITAAGGSYGANPTVTVTFPQAFVQAPIFVCSRGDNNAVSGYFVFTSSTTTTAVFTWVGTPSAAAYVLNAYGLASNLAQPALTIAAFALSTGWGATPTPLMVGTSTQTAFELQITAAGGSYGANPTVTLTFPTPYTVAPQIVCCRADTLANAGYFVCTSTSTTTAVFTFIGTPAAVAYKFCAIVIPGKVAGLLPSAFAASANFGATATVNVSAVISGSQLGFNAAVTASATPGANPTLTLTVPTALGQVPNVTYCRGDAAATAGYWAMTAVSATSATFTFVGTPVAGTTYTIYALVQLYAPGMEELPVGAVVPAGVIADTVYCEAITTRV